MVRVPAMNEANSCKLGYKRRSHKSDPNHGMASDQWSIHQSAEGTNLHAILNTLSPLTVICSPTTCMRVSKIGGD